MSEGSFNDDFNDDFDIGVDVAEVEDGGGSGNGGVRQRFIQILPRRRSIRLEAVVVSGYGGAYGELSVFKASPVRVGARLRSIATVSALRGASGGPTWAPNGFAGKVGDVPRLVPILQAEIIGLRDENAALREELAAAEESRKDLTNEMLISEEEHLLLALIAR